MKISAYHKRKGDRVEWFSPFFEYDKVYSSKVFTFTSPDPYLPSDAIRGGIGYGTSNTLPEEIEHILPDYSLYPSSKASLGFTTRGCIRNCSWCCVPKKEGTLRAHAEIKEFLREDSNKVVLMDNNILAHPHGLNQIEFCIDKNLYLDCNQGLDARLIAQNKDIANLLGRVHWIKYLRLACDTKQQMPFIETAVLDIRKHQDHKIYFFYYVLVKDIREALERVEFLRELNIDPFAQPYIDFSGKTHPTKEQKAFARWVNQKAVFKSTSWEKYKYNSV